jgi:glyoxylase-like metal-dependent hydrolase (beta-lactamase superfamily II)
MDYRVISIGTLSRNEFWGETAAVRTPHATTVLIRSGDRVIVVDPGLPPQVIAARLKERSGLDPSAVTDVFLTDFRPAHRWGLPAFEKARWLIGEAEREAVGHILVAQHKEQEGAEVRRLLEQDIAILKRCQAAPDRLAPQVDLFPVPGYTPGTCGLILSLVHATVVVAGDAVPTAEHLERGQVQRGGYDLAQARESFAEVIEIADIVIPGHDNLLLNPTRRTL